MWLSARDVASVLLASAAKAGVFRHAQVIQDQARLAIELPHFLSDVADAFGLNEADGKASETRDILWAITCTDSAPVFIVVPVQAPMTLVFNTPVATIDGKQLFGVRLLGREACHTIDGLGGELSGFLVDAIPLDGKNLSDMRKVQIPIELRGSPDGAGFNATMVWRLDMNEIGFCWLVEKQPDIFQESLLVAFDGEQIVGIASVD